MGAWRVSGLQEPRCGTGPRSCDGALVTIEASEAMESTPRSTGKSALRPRIEVITRGARRSWSPEQKRNRVNAGRTFPRSAD
jgi:hypothetical protein